MRFLKFLLPFLTGLFGNILHLQNDVINPAIQTVSGINALIQKIQAGEKPEIAFSFLPETHVDLLMSIVPDMIQEFKLVKIKEGATKEEILSAFTTYLSKQSDFVRDAILFKLASISVQKMAQALDVELTHTEADTLTQCAYAKAKSLTLA